MINLCKNEFRKIFKRPLFFGIMIAIMAICIGYGVLQSTQNKENTGVDSSWKEQLLAEINQLEREMNSSDFDENSRFRDEIQIKTSQFQYDNDISPTDWRYQLVGEYILLCNMTEQKNDQEVERMHNLKQIIQNNDWIAECDYVDNSIREEMTRYDPSSYQYQDALLRLEINQLSRSNSILPGANGWMNQILGTYSENKSKLLGNTYFLSDPQYYLLPNEVSVIQSQNEVLLYRLQHGLPEVENQSFAGFLNGILSVRVVLTLAVILIASLCITNEFSYGTINNLLIFPFSRQKILTSKIISIITCGIGLYAIFFISSLIIGWTLYREYPTDAVLIINGKVMTMDYIVYFLLTCLLSLFETLIYAMLAVLLSLMIKTSAVSLSIVTILAILSKSVLRYLSTTYRIGLLKYVPFASFDLNQFLLKDVIVNGLTLTTALIIDILTVIILLALSFVYFTKHEN